MKVSQPDILSQMMTRMIQDIVDERIQDIEANLVKKILIKNSPVLTVENVVELTGLKRSTIYTYMNEGKLTHYKISNKKVYFRLEDITSFIFNRENLRTSKTELKQEAFKEYLKLKS